MLLEPGGAFLMGLAIGAFCSLLASWIVFVWPYRGQNRSSIQWVQKYPTATESQVREIYLKPKK